MSVRKNRVLGAALGAEGDISVGKPTAYTEPQPPPLPFLFSPARFFVEPPTSCHLYAPFLRDFCTQAEAGPHSVR